MTRAIQAPVAPVNPGRRSPLCRPDLAAFCWSRALGGRILLPQGDSAAFLVVLDFIHEGADEQDAAAISPLRPGGPNANHFTSSPPTEGQR